MKKLLSIMLTLVLSVSLMGCTKKADDQVAAKVNDRVITVGEFNKTVEATKMYYDAQYGSDLWTKDIGDGRTYEQFIKEEVLNTMIENEIIMQEAEKEGIKIGEKESQKIKEAVKKNVSENKKEYEKKGITEADITEQYKKNQLTFMYINKYITEHPVTDKDALEFYDKNKSMYEKDQVRASHILFKIIDDNRQPLSPEKIKQAENKAKEIVIRAKNGEDFAKLANNFSEDQGTAKNGGDLGFFDKGKMVKAFDETAFSMKPGEVSDIVKTEYGYHIIKVTDKKKETKSFEEIKTELKAKMQEDVYKKHIEKLKEKAKIEQNKDLFKKK